MEATAFSEEADDYVEPDIPFPLSQLNFGSFFSNFILKFSAIMHI